MLEWVLPLKITCTCHQTKTTICCQTQLVTLISPKNYTGWFVNMLNPNLPSDLLSNYSSNTSFKLTQFFLIWFSAIDFHLKVYFVSRYTGSWDKTPMTKCHRQKPHYEKYSSPTTKPKHKGHEWHFFIGVLTMAFRPDTIAHLPCCLKFSLLQPRCRTWVTGYKRTYTTTYRPPNYQLLKSSQCVSSLSQTHKICWA